MLPKLGCLIREPHPRGHESVLDYRQRSLEAAPKRQPPRLHN